MVEKDFSETRFDGIKPIQSWPKIGLVSVLGLMLAMGLFFASYKLGQRQIQPPPGVREVNVSFGDNGSRVMLKVEETLVLRLGSNPSTGFMWEITELNEGILKQISHKYTPHQPILPGSGGEDIYYFRGEAEGRTALSLKHHRPWEKAEPTQTFKVEVVVR